MNENIKKYLELYAKLQSLDYEDNEYTKISKSMDEIEIFLSKEDLDKIELKIIEIVRPMFQHSAKHECFDSF